MGLWREFGLQYSDNKSEIIIVVLYVQFIYCHHQMKWIDLLFYKHHHV